MSQGSLAPLFTSRLQGCTGCLLTKTLTPRHYEHLVVRAGDRRQEPKGPSCRKITKCCGYHWPGSSHTSKEWCLVEEERGCIVPFIPVASGLSPIAEQCRDGIRSGHVRVHPHLHLPKELVDLRLELGYRTQLSASHPSSVRPLVIGSRLYLTGSQMGSHRAVAPYIYTMATEKTPDVLRTPRLT